MDKCLGMYGFWTFVLDIYLFVLTYKCPGHFKLTIIIMYCECCSLSPLSRLKLCCLQLPQSVYSVGGFATEAIIQHSATPPSSVLGSATAITRRDRARRIRWHWTSDLFPGAGPAADTRSTGLGTGQVRSALAAAEKKLSQIRGRGLAAPLPDLR